MLANDTLSSVDKTRKMAWIREYMPIVTARDNISRLTREIKIALARKMPRSKYIRFCKWQHHLDQLLLLYITYHHWKGGRITLHVERSSTSGCDLKQNAPTCRKHTTSYIWIAHVGTKNKRTALVPFVSPGHWEHAQEEVSKSEKQNKVIALWSTMSKNELPWSITGSTDGSTQIKKKHAHHWNHPLNQLLFFEKCWDM